MSDDTVQTALHPLLGTPALGATLGAWSMAGWLPLALFAAVALGTAFGMLGAARRLHGRHYAVWLQLPAGALLSVVLYSSLPPAAGGAGPFSTVVLLTPGATQAQLQHLPLGPPTLALPGAPLPTGAHRIPDLASALRAQPRIHRLFIVGDGLPARDREAAAGLQWQFDAAPEIGLLELQAPERVLVGQSWPLSGRVAADVAQINLRDPSGAISATTAPDRTGHFHLTAAAKGAGPQRFVLQTLDAAQAPIDTSSVPVVAAPGQALKIIVRAGPPNPELKYWRRWAADAGLEVALQSELSAGLAVHSNDRPLNSTTLAAADLLIVDGRAWPRLDAAEKSAVQAAVQDGLGLLLRVDGPISAATAADWATLGFRRAADDGEASETRELSLSRQWAAPPAAEVSIWPDRYLGGRTPAFLDSDEHEALGWLLSAGRGRIALLRTLDSYRLILTGQATLYNALWGQLMQAVARPQSALAAPIWPDGWAFQWRAQRTRVCAPGDDGSTHIATVPPLYCGTYWPAQSGWQQLQDFGSDWPYYVRDDDDGAHLLAHQRQQATRALLTGPPATGKDERGETDRWRQRLSATPVRAILLGVWLLLMSLVWGPTQPPARR